MAARALIALLLAVLSWPAFAQSFYLSAQPPANWRPASNYSDGFARVLVGKMGGTGIHKTGGAAVFLGPLTIHPGGWDVMVQVDPYPNDPVKSLLWKLTPGSEAHAIAGALVYGAGFLVSTSVGIGTRRLVLSAFMKFAQNAGADMARQAFRGSGVAAVAGMLAGAGTAWYWDQASQQWMKPAESSQVSTGFVYYTSYDPTVDFPTKVLACNHVGVLHDGHQGYPARAYLGADGLCNLEQYKNGTWLPWAKSVVQQRGSSCPAGHYITATGCSATPPEAEPVPEPDFEQKIKGMPWPDDLAEQLPDGVPVDPPVINPTPSPWDKAKPYFSPQGDPVPNPKYDPNSATSPTNAPRVQPGQEVQGSPTAGDPWRVSVRPVDRPITDPGPVTDPNVPPDPTKPPDDPANPTNPNGGNKPSERTPLLCEVFPHISACQVLGGPPSVEPIKNKDAPITHTPVAGFGPSNGACPPPRTIETRIAGPVEITWDNVCYVANGVRPIVIALAWLSAGFLMFRLR